jgi:hypothetical protein
MPRPRAVGKDLIHGGNISRRGDQGQRRIYAFGAPRR